MFELLDMGKNSSYIWSAYAIAAVVFIIIMATTRARRLRTERVLRELDTATREAGGQARGEAP